MSSDENESIYEEESYKPRKRLERRQVTQSTRRRSTLLYLEKYGLDQPNWYTSPDEQEIFTESPESIDHKDLIDNVLQQQQQQQQQRPTSFRNSVLTTSSQKRPGHFIKPEKSSFISPSLQINVLTPTEFKHVHKLFDIYSCKTYIEGYLYKKNHSNSDGSELLNQNWDLWYLELSGPVLTLWDAKKQSDQDMIMPQYINIMDSTVSLLSDQQSFSLNSAGANQFLFKSLNTASLCQWILAIRLSCFECARIQEIYTKAFIQRPQFNHSTSTRHKSKSGYVQVRFPGKTGWKRFWAVVANNHKLFSRKKNHPKVMFYESKKSKYPTMTLDTVVQAYTVYPESPKLIQVATLFKIEGALYNNTCSATQELVSASSSALVMAADTNDLVDWLMTIFDVFQLYGRPCRFLDDPKNQNALNFGEMENALFLNLEDVAEKVNVGLPSSLLLNKKEFSSILYNKLLRPPPIVTHRRTMECPCDSEEESDDDFAFKKLEKQASISEASDVSPSILSSDKPAYQSSVSTSSSTSRHVNKKPFYAQQKSVSTQHLNQFPSTPWPMYGSTGSILLKDHWEAPSRTPVHDTSMYKSPSSYYAASIGTKSTEDEDDENTPISESFSSLPFHQPKKSPHEVQQRKNREQMTRLLFEQQQKQHMMIQQYVQQSKMACSQQQQNYFHSKPMGSCRKTKRGTMSSSRSSVTNGSVYSDSRYTSISHT